MFDPEFFPTPPRLISRLLAGINWSEIETVAEPQAGKGDIAAKVALRIAHARRKHRWQRYEGDGKELVDCIELDETLRSTLKGAGFRVVHDDFLTYQTRKHYDLWVSNPPFSEGAKHLLKILELAQYGGQVRCILNAETIRNPYTNERRALARKLEDLGADITYLAGEFSKAERPTDVEVALIKVTIPNTLPDSIILGDLHEARRVEAAKLGQPTDIAPGDFVEAIVARYRLDVDAGVRLIREYQRILPYLLETPRGDSSGPILELTIDDRKTKGWDIVNDYVRLSRLKYWQALFQASEFTGQLTSNLQRELSAKVEELAEYEFSRVNILSIQRDLSRQTIASIEETILAQFDALSRQHSYDKDSANIHYYNGWCTNKAWKINEKVILPAYGCWEANIFHKWRFYGRISEELRDLEKCLAFLNGGLPPEASICPALKRAEDLQQSANIESSFFTVTFYKKGTCHIRFLRKDLLDRMNRFGAQRKQWLPPSYGKRKYADMDQTERAAVDEFEGEASYARVVADPGNYIIEPAGMLQLEGAG